MTKSKGLNLGNTSITVGVIFLVVFGSFMIASAEMGNSAGDTGYLTNIIIKQTMFAIVGLAGYFIISKISFKKMRMEIYWMLYTILLLALLACRFFGATNGAYAWIPIGSFASVQPSEFAKAFMVIFAAKLFGKDSPKNNLKNIKTFGICAAAYFVIILLWQHDLGSAIVLAVMCYCMALIPSYKQYKDIHKYMIIIILAVLCLVPIIFIPFVNELMSHSSNYMIGRFLAANDPFKYRYDNGYHVVMSLVSFANGNWFGLGYTNSIHKYMNFPNPSNDFILPVIVEELGIVGFGAIILGYALILYPIIKFSMKTENVSSKIVSIGVVTYFLAHFIFNVGGVSGFIPLTGVPLLIISSGGSSLIACLASVGMAQNEIISDAEENNESNRG